MHYLTDNREILSGRHHHRLTIFWRKNISHFCQVITFDDKHTLGLKVNCPHNLFRENIVYLSYYSEDNYDAYLFYIDNPMSIKED